MTVNNALSYIKEELKFEAKKYFYEKYSALDSEISIDGFVYTGATETATHQYKAITDSFILKTINDSLINVSMNTTPVKLLERTGGIPSILRYVDKYWYVRTPSYPTVGGSLDIDDGLGQVVVFKSLATLGITKYVQTAKEMIDSYSKSVIMPDIDSAQNELGFRFSIDGSTLWHDTYQNGDMYMSISINGAWGNAIPIAVVDNTVNATEFAELTDVAPMVANKILKVNATADGIIMADEAVGGGASEGRTDVILSSSSSILDLSVNSRIFNIGIDSNVTIDFKKVGIDYDVVDGAVYTLLISPSTFTVTFNAGILISGLTPINPTSTYVSIVLLSAMSQFFVLSQMEY